MMNQYRVRIEVHQGEDFNGNVLERTVTVSARNMDAAVLKAASELRRTYPNEIMAVIGNPVRVETMADLKRESEQYED